MRAILTILAIFISVSFVAGQSGRRIKKSTTVRQEKQVAPEDLYSESSPFKTTGILPLGKSRNSRATTKRKAPESTDASTGDDDIIKIDSTLVTIPISIFSRNGLYITDVRPEEIKIYEDGVEQEVAYFGISKKPFTVAVVIDTSNSAEFKIEQIRSAAKRFVEKLTPEDTVMVMTFDNRPRVLAEPTKDRATIYRAIDRARFGGGTALYDAVDRVINRHLNKIEGRKAAVIFTDGVDTTSRNRYDTTLRDAEESGTIFFPIYFNTFSLPTNINGGNIGTGGLGGLGGIGSVLQTQGSTAAEYDFGKSYLESLASYTGGRMFDATRTYRGLERSFENIAEELGRQYNLAYYPLDEGEIGDRKRIRVRVLRQKLVVRARDSYVVGSNQ